MARATRAPKVPVGTPAGSRANTASFLLTALGGLASGWTLIHLGRGLGAVTGTALTRSPTADGDWRAHLLAALLGALLAGACQLAVELTARTSAAGQEGAIRARALGHLLALGPGRAREHRSGATVSLLTDGAERVALYRQTFLAPTVAAALSPALVLILLGATVDWLSAVVLALAVVLIPGFISVFHSKVRRSSSGSRRQRTRLSAEYLDAIQGLTTLVLARAARRTHESLRREGEANRRAVMGLLAGNQLVILVTDGLFSLFFVAASAALALARLGSGAIGPGDALAIVLVSYTLLEPLDRVGAFFYVGMGGLANQRALRALLATERADGAALPDGESLHEPTTPPDRAGGAGGTWVDGARLSLNGVTATWARPDDDAPAVLDDVDLSIEPGERVAVVGPSGAGKSTLVSLVSGDLLPAAGTVRVDGTALTAATQDEVRAASAVVAQTTWLFTGTIADNLRLADPGATEERMWQALEAAHLADEVRLMPEGLHTLLGEQGLGLSGGQAQRVSLARAFLANRPLLVLDEPTSQVDLDSEARIVQAIERVSAGRTVLTVSHRAGAVTGADRVLRVQDGRVAVVTPSQK
ncbi:ABC transporter ATP-binding protein/permease, partial [Actinomyces sp. 217892]